MKPLLFSLLLLRRTSYANLLLPRASGEDYINSVCSPNITASGNPTVPPCTSVIDIQNQCAPNGTQPVNFIAHAQCMCSSPSTFFADWQGCQNCLLVHGARSEQDINKFLPIISSASAALCSGTPTAAFDRIFSSLADKASPAMSGASISSDRYPSQTAVSLYYTASGKQGPGAITGNATTATKAATRSSSVTTTSVTTGGQSIFSPSAVKPAGTSSSSNSKNGAVATNGAGAGWGLVALGGALLAM